MTDLHRKQMHDKNHLLDDDDDDDDTKDPTAPFYELEEFDSIWQALEWRQIQTRIPVCFNKTIRSRYMLANLVYLLYAIGIVIVDFHPKLDGTSSINNYSLEETYNTKLTTTSILDRPVRNNPFSNSLNVASAVVHLISASLYVWVWKGRSWLDVIMIPEYLNHIEAGLYLWSAIWYHKQTTLGGSYTLAIHKIELTAAIVELIASFLWIMSWYMTYTRTLGRGFSLDDPDTHAYLTTTIASIMYLIYNINMNIHPEEYDANDLYKYADILYLVGAICYILAGLRDDHWFWFLPLSGQYGVALGKVETHSRKVLPTHGKPVVLISDACRRHRIRIPRKNQEENQLNTIPTSIKNYSS